MNESGPTIDLAPSPVSCYRSPPHTVIASLTQMGIIPAAFCQVSMALCEAAAAVLATSFVMIIFFPSLYSIHVKEAATYIASAPATIFNNDNGITAGPDR